MSKKPTGVLTLNEKRLSFIRLPKICAALILILIGLSACAPVVQEAVVIEPPKTPQAVKKVHSADAIIPATIIDARFAQQALSKLGYKIGAVDGLWGPRSASAIRAFEAQQGIISANGHLSELNLHELEVASGLSRETYGATQTNSHTGVSAKLNRSIPLSQAPQLIIVDHQYKVLSKPNPYSSEILTLAPGTGIYVISEQDGYFEIESINRKRGYIKID